MIKRYIKFILFLLFHIFITLTPLSAQSAHKSLRNGDRKYDQEQYKEAEKHYRDAADRQYGEPGALYNLGNSYYQQGKWEDAAARFSQAANSATDPAVKADAFHNLGNSLLKQHKYAEAVKAYENSLRLRPGDAASKQNLQMAKKKLKEEQQRQQQQKKQEESRRQNQDQQQSQSREQQQENQQQQPKPEENQSQPQTGEPQNSNKEQQNGGKLKREEAQRLLERVIGPEDRKNAKKYREQRQQPKPSGKEKDW